MKNLRIHNIRGKDLNPGLRDFEASLQYSLTLSHTHIRSNTRACDYSTMWALNCVTSYCGIVSFFCSVHERSTGLFISPSGISELDCATTKTDTAERSISIGRESLQVFFLLGALAYFQVPPLGGSREEKWRSQ